MLRADRCLTRMDAAADVRRAGAIQQLKACVEANGGGNIKMTGVKAGTRYFSAWESSVRRLLFLMIVDLTNFCRHFTKPSWITEYLCVF
jgi:signal recognition particle GTPase